jgi:hypothetical protein
MTRRPRLARASAATLPAPRRALAPATLLALATLSALVTIGVLTAPAARAQAPWWHLTSNARPYHIPPGGEATLVDQAVNVGDAQSTGTVTISDTLSAGLTVQGVSLYAFSAQVGKLDMSVIPGVCQVSQITASCSTQKPEELALMSPLLPYEEIEMRVRVKADAPGAPGAGHNLEVRGGGIAPQSLSRALHVSSAPVPFGVEDFAMTPEEEGGQTDTQAGSHPFQLTTTFALNQTAEPLRPPALARNLTFKLPPGLIGNATILPQCTDLEFRHVVKGGEENLCPADSAVGVASLTIYEPQNVELASWPVPLFNLVPARGEPARFGFEVASSLVTLDTSVRSGSDYGVNVSTSNISQLAALLSSTVSFWGVPGDPRHDSARGWSCLVGGHWTNTAGRELPCVASAQSKPKPFLALPSSCEGTLQASVQGISWPNAQNPAGASLQGAQASLLQGPFGAPLSLTGCNRLPFGPSIQVSPETHAASTPSGLQVAVRVPQEVDQGAEGLSSSAIKDTSVTLPQGVGLNPAAAAGLGACSEAEVGFQAIAADASALFTPDLPVPFCPQAAKIGTVTFKVPVIEDPLQGSVYLATQNENPFGSLVAIYVVAEDPTSGVLIKLAGEVSLSESGQITTTFKGTPQAPLEEASFSFFGGPRAALSTPAHCGPYTTSASFTPYSGQPPQEASSSFQITEGPGGQPCPPAQLPFSPSLQAGTTSNQAGAFSPLSTTIARADGQQQLQSVSLQMPPGLSGVLAGIPLCPQAQADAGGCSQASRIGSASALAGVGGSPYLVQGGQVFLTEGYGGAPFGLSIVTPAKAGPFDLGEVIVRAKLQIDPLSAQVTVQSDPIPRILKGVPLQIRQVNVRIDRPGFTFNPTDCAQLQIEGSALGAEGASSPLSEPFRAANCSRLSFKPKFRVSTSAHTSKARGASLKVSLSYPEGALGSYANIAKVKVSLPKALPSRLTTLQRACLAKVFDANPQSCPSASAVGHATVKTPLLPVPLKGPAYFVSHGGEAFPDLTIVLEGYGVTVRLVGSTQIKNGITTSTFKAAPDVPFESFTLDLPQGPYSALTANTNLCRSKLIMPSAFTAQNGALYTQQTRISVSGCKRALTRAQKLARALGHCRKAHRRKGARRACQVRARRRFGGRGRR